MTLPEQGHPERGPVDRDRTRTLFELTRYLDSEGKLASDAPAFATDPEALVPLYKAMVLTRIFDEKAVALQRTGRLGTFASSLGQEAVSVGTASAMMPDDVLVPSFREQGGQLWRGVTAEELLLYWGGDERGSDFAGPRNDFPISIPVATQVPHAVGVALAFKLRGEPRVAVCVFGDGATSKGDFYEAINLAAVWRVPAVFVINNNQWAISVPRAAQSAASTLAQKAIAVGMPGERVDGNDIIAVKEIVGCAIEQARRGEGPTLIEAVTYRLTDHTTADDASRYRSDAEVSAHWRDEPVMRLRRHLVALGCWSKEDEEALLTSCQDRVTKAAESASNRPPPPATDMFDYQFSQLPRDLAEQRDRALAALSEARNG